MKVNLKSQVASSLLLLIMIVGLVNSCHAVALVEEDGKSLDLTVSIPTEGNSWVVDDTEKSKQIVKKGGIRNWSENETKIRTYFKTTKTGKLDVGIFVKATFGSSKIRVSCNGKTEIVQIESKTEGEIPIGTFEVKKAGYQWIEIQGVDKSGDFYPLISCLISMDRNSRS